MLLWRVLILTKWDFPALKPSDKFNPALTTDILQPGGFLSGGIKITFWKKKRWTKLKIIVEKKRKRLFEDSLKVTLLVQQAFYIYWGPLWGKDYFFKRCKREKWTIQVWCWCEVTSASTRQPAEQISILYTTDTKWCGWLLPSKHQHI